MASGHGEAKAKSDTPWLIASGGVTILSLAYILSPPGKSAAHHEAAKAHPIESALKSATKEGAEARGKGETPASAEAKPAQPEEPESKEQPSEDEGVEDDEGQKASSEEVKESVDKATDTDAPKDAKAAEEQGDGKSSDDKWAEGAPGQTDAVHDHPVEQQVKKSASPNEKKPTNIGDARKAQVEEGDKASQKRKEN